MIDRKILTTCLAIAVVTLPGCPNPSGGSVAFEALPTQLAQAQCSYATRCGMGLGVYENYVLHEEITDCPAQLTAFVEASALGPIAAGIADGSIRYHADLAAACVGSYNSASCGGSGVSEDCFDVFEGTLADGAACSNSEQCSGASTCDNSHAGMCPSGVCVHVPQLGEACESSCGLGLYCASGTCAHQLAAGAACDPTGFSQCGSGLTCEGSETDPEMGTCTAITPGGVGDRCTNGCQAGLVCGGTGMCRQPRTDGTCEVIFGSPVDECGSGEGCVATEPGGSEGTCEPLPTAGETCTTICARGSRCISTPGGTGTCTVPVANGGACETDGVCLSGFCSSGHCAAPPLCRPS